jgi:hypothetical protein
LNADGLGSGADYAAKAVHLEETSVTEAEWQKSLNGSAMIAVVSSKGSERL